MNISDIKIISPQSLVLSVSSLRWLNKWVNPIDFITKVQRLKIHYEGWQLQIVQGSNSRCTVIPKLVSSVIITWPLSGCQPSPDPREVLLLRTADTSPTAPASGRQSRTQTRRTARLSPDKQYIHNVMHTHCQPAIWRLRFRHRTTDHVTSSVQQKANSAFYPSVVDKWVADLFNRMCALCSCSAIWWVLAR